MSHPIHHTASSVRLFGGGEDDYFEAHHWLDATKECFADCRHRALRHHDQGINWAQEITKVSVQVLEQHIMEDCAGRIPTLHDWAQEIKVQDWMQSSIGVDAVLEKAVHRWGGEVQEYTPYVQFFNEHLLGPQWGFLRLHAQGIFELERKFGTKHANNSSVPVRYIGELIVKHMVNARGRIPSVSDWLASMRMQVWMNRPFEL